MCVDEEHATCSDIRYMTNEKVQTEKTNKNIRIINYQKGMFDFDSFTGDFVIYPNSNSI